MIDKGKLIKDLESQYKVRQQQNDEQRLTREKEVLEKHPDIRRLMDARWALLYKGLDIGAGHDLSDAPIQMEGLNRSIRQALARYGYPEDYLQPHYDCPVCQDKGYLGDEIRDMCPCFKAAYHQRLFKEVGLSEQSPQTFEAFDPAVYDGTPVPGLNASQRDVACLHEKTAREYAENFPNVAPADLLLQGKSGVGKTFILHAIAHRALEKGHSVLCVSAYKVIELARRAHYANDLGEMESLMETELLLIDDLGTEPMMENVTIPAIYNLVNERQQNNRHTVITTNLSKDEIKQRYTERIASRLLNPKQCRVMAFVGEDVRRRPGL